MAKIICKLPNASELINGVKFVTHKLGMVSEEIADEVAAEFVKIEGYVLAEAEKATAAVTGGRKGGKGADKGAASGGQDSAGGDESKPDGGSDNGAGEGDENKPKDPPAGGSDGTN